MGMKTYWIEFLAPLPGGVETGEPTCEQMLFAAVGVLGDQDPVEDPIYSAAVRYRRSASLKVRFKAENDDEAVTAVKALDSALGRVAAVNLVSFGTGRGRLYRNLIRLARPAILAA